jgi:adenosylhomocysteine nucleosidase
MDTLPHFEENLLRIGIIAALPGELKPLVRDWQASALNDGTRIWSHAAGNGDVWIAACSGMGAEAARRAFAGAESAGPLELVLSVGWAGAVYEGAKPGQALVLSIIIDAKTGEQFQLTTGKRKLTLVTAARVVDAKEKQRLRATYPGAVMVDMEAATVARLAQMRGIPAACIKGVSDGVGAELPDLNPFISSLGHLRLIPFLAYLAVRPLYWKAIAELNRNSRKAALAMRNLILAFMEEKNVDKLNRTGSP